jgi:flagellar biosynthesis protein FliR
MSLPYINFESLTPTLLLGIRMSGLMTFAPFVSNASIPWQVKSGLTAALTALLAPAYMARVPTVLANWPVAIIGLGLGLVLEMVFEGARFAGTLLGFQFGYSLVNIIDPESGVDTTVLNFFHYTFLMLIFLQGDMHHWVFRLLVHSFDVIAPGGAAITPTTLSALLRLGGGIFLMGLQMAAPALTATLMVEMALSFMAKASPQLPILLVGLPLKMLAGYAAIWGAVVFWPIMAQRWFTGAFQNAEHLLQTMR